MEGRSNLGETVHRMFCACVAGLSIKVGVRMRAGNGRRVLRNPDGTGAAGNVDDGSSIAWTALLVAAWPVLGDHQLGFFTHDCAS